MLHMATMNTEYLNTMKITGHSFLERKRRGTKRPEYTTSSDNSFNNNPSWRINSKYMNKENNSKDEKTI